MNESYWDLCSDPRQMLPYIDKRTGERALRLFSCACCRRVWLSLGAREREAIRVAERYVDGEAKVGSLRNAARSLPFSVAGATFLAPGGPWARTDHADHALWTAKHCLGLADTPSGPERSTQARLLRCVFGNPFRATSLDSSLRTPDVLTLAQGAYKERIMPEGTLDATRLAVLADALEEAGARDFVLDHLRGPGPHVRGCHVVDLLLGK